MNIARNVIQTRGAIATALLTLIGGLIVVVDSLVRFEASMRYFVGAHVTSEGQFGTAIHIEDSDGMSFSAS